MLMKNMLNMALEEFEANQKLASRLEQLLKKSPEGRVEMTVANGRPKFYLISRGDRKYLGRNKAGLIQKLIEKNYYKQLLRETRKTQTTLKRFLNDYDPEAQSHVYEQMHVFRKEQVTPLVMPFRDYAEKWLSEHRARAAASPNTYPKSGEFITNNGEVVRSKSEKIIADLLQRLGLYYVYECPLEVNGTLLYPDFAILNPITRETWYLEHRGRMDQADYAEDALQKERLYASCGLFPGLGLIISEETLAHPLQTRDLENMIRRFFFD